MLCQFIKCQIIRYAKYKRDDPMKKISWGYEKIFVGEIKEKEKKEMRKTKKVTKKKKEKEI